MKNMFELNRKQLREIVWAFRERVEEGLNSENTQIKCLPTYIIPNTEVKEGKALVLDLGGTNYRAAIVEFKDGQAEGHPKNSWKKRIDEMKAEGFTSQQLYDEMADLIEEMNHDQELPIGYCFSYPAESQLDGDATLLHWTKGVDIKDMVGKPVGKPLMDDFNRRGIARFTSVKVINDTVASLFAGLTDRNYDAYIGLIVGTGCNMATFIPADHIKKLNPEFQGKGLIPINLESGNFYPPYLFDADDWVDELTDTENEQRFEKAVSGMYLGELFKQVFPHDQIKKDFNAGDMNHIVNNPQLYKKEYVDVANWIFRRSAQLVAASLAGMILELRKYNPQLRRVSLTAEGSLFWSKIAEGEDYHEMVMGELYGLLGDFGFTDITVGLEEKANINLVGTAIAALS